MTQICKHVTNFSGVPRLGRSLESLRSISKEGASELCSPPYTNGAERRFISPKFVCSANLTVRLDEVLGRELLAMAIGVVDGCRSTEARTAVNLSSSAEDVGVSLSSSEHWFVMGMPW